MKKLMIILMIVANFSCAQSADGKKGILKTGELGSAEQWQQIQNSILFNKVTETQAIFALPQDRPKNLQVEYVLNSLHSWFKLGTGYTPMYDYTYEYLLLEKIPDKVFAEIQTRMTTPSTGFAILDKKFWADLQSYQKKGFRFALITNSPILIAGFYSNAQNLVAFDLFSNSGTITHEMQHHLDHDELQSPPWWPWFDGRCREQLSTFLGEVSATTQQLLTWNDVILNRSFVSKTIEEYDAQGGKMVADNFIYALQANLEYPTERGNAFIQRNSCPKFVEQIVEDIRELTSRQVEDVIRYEDNLTFTMKLRVETGESLKKAATECVGKSGSSTTACLDAINNFKEFEHQADFERKELANRVYKAWEERVTVIPQILNHMEAGYFIEACNTVLGFKKLAHCNANRVIEAR